VSSPFDVDDIPDVEFGSPLKKAWQGPGCAAINVHWHGEPDEAPLKEWLVYRMFPRVGKALIAGQWGTYKTFAALDLAASVITKTPFAGRNVDRQGGVLFIAAEGQDEVRIRLQGLVEGKVVPALERENDDVMPVDPARLPFAWLTECPRLSNDDALAILRAVVSQVSQEMDLRGIPLALIIIDTMMAAGGFKDANDASEAQRVMDVLSAVANEFQALVVAIDHFGKNVETGTRNSSVKEDNVDAVLALLGEKDLSGKVRNTRAAVRKVRGAQTGEEIAFSVRIVDLGLDEDGRAIDTLVIDWQAEQNPQPRATPKNPWKGNARYLKNAMDALGDKAKPLRPFGFEGPEVKAIDREDVRREFYAAYPADGETEKAKAAARQKAFKRAIDSTIDANAIAAREIEGVTWLWEIART
jgi:hypothetical protein